MNKKVGKIILLVVITIIAISAVVALSNAKTTKVKQTVVNQESPLTKPSQSSANPSVTSPVTLNAQIKPIFTNVTNMYIQLYNQGVTDSSSATMQNYTTFNTYSNSFVSSKPVPSLVASLTAVNKANSLYNNAGLTPAPILKQWYNDNTSVWEDISQWSTDEDIVLGEEATGSSPSSSQTNAVSNDLNMYNQDLAATQHDISQL
jgi:hypothetical protein